MTREEILNMSAGYEIRKLVGVHVMGWNQQGKWWVGNHLICPVSAWKPDEDILHAWAVIEYLRKRFGYRVFSDVNKNIGQCHTVNFYNNKAGEYGSDSYYASAETAPLAICRAALLAVMELK